MATGRHLRKSISCSERMANLKTHGARLLYTWTLAHMDVNGNFWGNPHLIKSQVFPLLPDTIKEIQSYISDIEKQGLLVKYKVEGKSYIHYTNFRTKQVRLENEKTELPLYIKENGNVGTPTESRPKTPAKLIKPNLTKSKLIEVKKKTKSFKGKGLSEKQTHKITIKPGQEGKK